MTDYFKKLLFSIGVLSVAVFPLQVNAQANSGMHQYVVQLNPQNPDVLKTNSFISNAKELFQFNHNSKFANTFQFQSSESLVQLQQDLAGEFVYLQEDTAVQAGDVKINSSPNDPGFTTNSKNTDKQWALPKAGFVEAWKKTTGNKNIIVAIVDTGIDGTHEDLSSSHIVAGYDITSDTKIIGHANSDDNGHGTLIAGVIAATSNNTIGIAGAAPGVSIMPVKALDADGSGSSSKISEGIVWAADHNASVINLSLGGIGFGHDKVLANAITYAFDKDVVIISAAGNDVAVTGGNLDTDPVFPICDDNGKNMIIGVTATDANDLKPSFANFGKACVDVSAPGKRIMSTINHDPATGGSAPDSYAYASGTSLAVPFVSAQAALLRSLYPDVTNKQIRDRIISTSEDVDDLNLSQCAGQSCKGLLGGGRINVAKSMEQQIVKLVDGDLVKVDGRDLYYYINGGKKQMVSTFVKNQRFATTSYKTVAFADLQSFPEGSYAEPLDGTLVKTPNDGTVYYMESGLRRPLTYQVFLMRGFSFATLATLPSVEVNSWIVGSFLTPPDGTIVRSKSNPTVYWVVNGSLRPVSYNFYISRGLNKTPITYISDGDISKFPKGDSYIQ